MVTSICRSILNTLTCHRGKLLEVSTFAQSCSHNSLHSLAKPFGSTNLITRLSAINEFPGNCWSLTSVRTAIRNNMPRPNERKRFKLSFYQRMKTRSGRAIIMRRYLRGRHVLTH